MQLEVAGLPLEAAVGEPHSKQGGASHSVMALVAECQADAVHKGSVLVLQRGGLACYRIGTHWARKVHQAS